MGAKNVAEAKKPHSWGEVAKNSAIAIGAIAALAVGVEILFD